MTEQPNINDGVLDWCGEQLVLLPQRAVWWPARQSLFIADPHFGKAATFRAANIPLPEGSDADLQRLDQLIEQTRPNSLIVLGDLLHARAGRCATLFERIRQWRQRHRSLHMQLVIGNHDVRAGLPPADWEIECVAEPAAGGSFQWCHYPPFAVTQPALAGHLHPKFKQYRAGDLVVAPCFLLRANSLVLPAFSSFVDSLAIDHQPGDVFFVIADDSICRVAVR
ncbi:ligase-associated DNA damage response endonuclease PdeM [Anatilimnocola sp. NA78]|uniref:ligase-associated DNA damage response endonuclease PdeM n=1 Tax=Anatilimnocola sp. NA78 TaxID=3415683 RepID=UPI003CE4AB9D